MTDHSRFRELAALRLDFRPSAGEAAELAAHLGACVECRRYAAGLQADQDLVRSRTGAHAPDRVRRAVVDRAYGSAPRVGVGRLLPLVAALVVALAVLARSAGLVGPQVAAPGPLSPLTWTRLGAVSALEGGLVTDVTSAGSLLIASGAIPAPPPEDAAHGTPMIESAAAWVSSDGRAWTRVPPDPAFSNAAALDVVVGGNQLLVLGVSPAPIESVLPLRTPVVVDSPVVYHAWLANLDQLCAGCGSASSPWQTVLIDAGRSGRSTSFYADAALTRAGYVLVGAVYPATMSPHGLNEPLGALIARSTDGLTWTFNDPLEPTFSSGSMQGVADGPSGLVAVGDIGLKPSVWTSPDGVSWAQVGAAITSPGASVRDVASSPDGYVAVGDDGGSARSWTSTDGRTWTAGASSPDLTGTRMIRVDWLGSEYVATGTAADGTGLAWRSVDGVTWRRIDPGFTFGVLEAAGGIDSRMLLFGSDVANQTAVAVGTPSGQP